MTDSDFIAEIIALVRDTSQHLAIPGDYERCLNRALERYSQDRPTADATPHTVDGDGSTVYAGDFYAVCKLAAAEACGILAQEFIPTVTTYPQADFAALDPKVEHYRNRRRDLRQEYADHMNLTGAEADFVMGEISTNWIEAAEAEL